MKYSHEYVEVKRPPFLTIFNLRLSDEEPVPFILGHLLDCRDGDDTGVLNGNINAPELFHSFHR